MRAIPSSRTPRARSPCSSAWRPCSGCCRAACSAAHGSPGGTRAARDCEASKIKIMRRVTLTQFLVSRQRDKNLINADLRLLIETIARACKGISTRVNKGALADGLGSAGTSNIQGEVQKKLDVLANESRLGANEWGGNLAGLASEEMDNPRPIPTNNPGVGERLLFDPL